MGKKPDLEFLTADEDIVTPERLAKGDLVVGYNAKEKINSASPVPRLVIKKLMGRGVLDYFHEIYGVGFLELRAAFRAPWAVRSAAVLTEQWGTGVSVSYATDIYQNVCRGLIGRGKEVVEYALETEGYEARYDDGSYLEHFDRLVGLMDSERERIARISDLC